MGEHRYPRRVVADFLRSIEVVMRRCYLGLLLVVICLSPARVARAQWHNPRLIAGQAAFNIAVSFIGKMLLHHEPPGRALSKALVEGTASGLVAHADYCLAGQHPHWALAGKALAQKSSLMTRQSMHGTPVFDRSLYSHWQITHSFVYIEVKGAPRVEIDVPNAAVAAYFLTSDDLRFDLNRTLYSGSFFFRNENELANARGFSAPGAIWIRSSHYNDPLVFGHEMVHSLQNERGSAIADWHYKGLRFNFLALAPGVPALLKGWPDHNQRLHEREAGVYADLP